MAQIATKIEKMSEQFSLLRYRLAPADVVCLSSPLFFFEGFFWVKFGVKKPRCSIHAYRFQSGNVHSS